MKIKAKHVGSFVSTDKKLKKYKRLTEKQIELLHLYGKKGVDALQKFTPTDTGKTAQSWYYTIQIKKNKTTLIWCNDNMTEDNVPIAILIQYGHATKDGYFIKGTDYINPALKSVFEDIAKDSWKEVCK